MTSSLDAGYHQDQALKEMDKPCPKGGKHNFENVHKHDPSWRQCTKCGKNIYFK